MWGKLLGALFGIMLTGSLFGGILGMLLGHYFDAGLKNSKRSFFSGFQGAREKIQHAFFKATFMVMGHVAKADGRVSEREIHMARGLMDRMRLSTSQKEQAINYFREGKSEQFNLKATLDELLDVCHGQRVLLQMFIEIQFQAANIDGITPAKQHILETICHRLGFSSIFQQFYSGQGAAGGRYQSSGQRTGSMSQLQAAFKTLGISKDASKQEVKRAYRKLMSENHPDKLIAKGLPEEMIRLATDKTQKIQKAYETICGAKNY